jgi:hypothetical protein
LSGIHMWFGCECCIGEAAASTARTIERNTWEKSTGFITHITCQQIQLRCTIRLSILSDCQFTGLKHKHWTETQPCSTSTYGQNTSHEISTGTHISASSFCGRKSKETSKRGLNWHLEKKNYQCWYYGLTVRLYPPLLFWKEPAIFSIIWMITITNQRKLEWMNE